MVLDAETFDYTFHLKAGEGFKIAVHHHLDQPIMSIKELDISPGSVFQVAVTPTLMSTTAEAISRFSPLERGCYIEGELPLQYLPSVYYRYEMSNCLFEAAYESIIAECRCMPSFHQLAHKEVTEICSGPSLTCMNKILRFIGKLNKVSECAVESSLRDSCPLGRKTALKFAIKRPLEGNKADFKPCGSQSHIP